MSFRQQGSNSKMGQGSAMDWGSASAAQSDVDPPSLIGTLVAGKFRVDKLLGSGSTGDVYLSTHIGLDKVVALKVLHADMVKHENFVERFKREARAASRLEHPNSVRVLDFGEDPNGVLYIAMEFIDGRDLWSLLDEEWPLDNARIVDIMSQVLGALAKAHSLGIVHRDLKPENIMVRRSAHEDGDKDIVTVCDFGIAQLSPIQLSGASQQVPTVTGEGMVVGTPAYMSPEQARAEPLDARSDVYSAGVVLFQMLTRQLPFTAETPLAVAVMHCSSPPPTPSQLALVHPALESVCLRALCKAKEARYQSARDMQLALQAAVAATAAQLVPKPKKRRVYPLSAPPLEVPPPRQPRQQSPASLAPFELHAEPELAQAAKPSRKGAMIAAGFMAVTLGLSAMTLWGAGGSDSEAPAAASKSSQTSSVHMDGKAHEAQPPSAPTPPVPVAREHGQHAEHAEIESASAAFARVQQAANAAATASSTPVSQQPSASARSARSDQDGREGRDVKAKAAPAENLGEKPGKKAAVTVGGRRLQPLAADDFEADDSEPARFTVTPAPSEGSRTKDAASKPLAATADGAPGQAVAKSVPVEPEIPVGLVELPNRGRVVVAAEPTEPVKPAAGPATLAMGSYEHAQVHFGSITTQAAVSKASIRNALNEGAMRRCYTDALRLGAAGGGPMSAQLELATNMGGRIASANVSGGLPKQLANCVEQVAKSGRVREVDTGIAKATVTLEFQP
jgi:serine/threonine protein kinase